MHSSQGVVLGEFVILDGSHSRSDRRFRVAWALGSQSVVLGRIFLLDGSLSRSNRWHGKKSYLGIVFYPLFKVWPLGQRVRGVGFTGPMLDDIMVFLSNLIPSGLSATKVLGFCEILQILVICEDHKRFMSV